MEKEAENGAFLKAYKGLNDEQRRAVDTIEGPVMVIAGPGTGKTQILTLRIANILQKTDMTPENILALTFTEAGAKAMRERLRGYIGSEAYRIPIFTFHGFCEQLIRRYPDSYERVIGGRPATDLEKINIIETILNDGDVRLLRPHGDPSYYVTPLISIIATMKREYITPASFRERITHDEELLAQMPQFHEKGAHKGKVRSEYTKKEKSIAKNKELLYVYQRYEALLASLRIYDFDDMIVETIRALEGNEDMLRDLQETYQYIHADEHQDVNGSQNRILELLASYHEQPNIFVVGDEKQAIFRFQGASLENFLYFEDVFKGTTMITLTTNYRSPQQVLDVAHSLIQVAEGPLKDLRVPLTAFSKEVKTVERRDFSHQAIEDASIVTQVAELLEKGILPEEIAVIVRTNREVEQFAEKLRGAGIAVLPSADSDILLHPITHAVCALIDAVIESESETALFNVLHGAYWGISQNDLVRVASARNFDRTLARIMTDETLLQELGVENIPSVMRVAEVLTKARALEVSEAPHRILQFLLSESGFLEHVVRENPLEGVRVVRRIYDEVEEMVRREGIGTIRDIGNIFTTRKQYRLPLSAPFIGGTTHAVRVMTAHKSKGLEFDAVFIPHLVDSVWGKSNSRNLFDITLTKHVKEKDFDPVDDERRLFYVAMTRAKKQLFLSGAETNSEGKPLSPSRLFEDIDESLLTPIATETEEVSFNPAGNLSFHPSASPVEPALLRDLFLSRGLSATHLNNYLESPWNYFFRNLLRIPEVQKAHMQYGTAIHGVLERVTKTYTASSAIPSDTEIKKMLDVELGRLPLTKEEFVRFHEKGLAALFAYIPHLRATLGASTKEEFSFRVVLETGDAELPEIPLTGKLDRLDFDAEGRLTCVVDYKTGAPKTRNAILGATKGSNGAYKRQLVFYALLLSLYNDERYESRTMRLSFVEPDSKGSIREEDFEITDEEIETLKTEIVKVAKEITTGSFLALPCNREESEYCNLAEAFRERRI